MKDPKQQRYPTKKDPRYLWKIYRMEDTKWKIWKIRNERYKNVGAVWSKKDPDCTYYTSTSYSNCKNSDNNDPTPKDPIDLWKIQNRRRVYDVVKKIQIQRLKICNVKKIQRSKI